MQLVVHQRAELWFRVLVTALVTWVAVSESGHVSCVTGENVITPDYITN